MNRQLSFNELQIIEDNLSCLKGEKGIEIANKMKKNNSNVTKSSICALHLKENDIN